MQGLYSSPEEERSDTRAVRLVRSVYLCMDQLTSMTSLHSHQFSQCNMHAQKKHQKRSYCSLRSITRVLDASRILGLALRGPRSCESSRRGFGGLDQSESSKHKLFWTLLRAGGTLMVLKVFACCGRPSRFRAFRPLVARLRHCCGK